MNSRPVTFVLLLLMIVLSACASAIPSPSARESATPQPTRARSPSPPSTPATEVRPSPTAPLPAGAAREFRTDWSKHTVPFDEILSGGPPKDGIPAIDHPRFVDVEEANTWLKPREPVIPFEMNGDVRAYPIQILIWHEIVNDEVGGVPVAITFCPLCNTAIAFDRRVGNRVLDFGTTGRLRFSNLIMYDRQTETWWQQATGEAIIGELAGERLTFLPASIIAWEEFKTVYPDGKVLSRETGYHRDYGKNPYFGYDSIDNSPFLYVGPETPHTLPPMARVLTVDLNGEAVAYPYDILAHERVVNNIVGGQPIVVLWQPGVASPLDKVGIAEGRDVGTAVAFSRQLEGRVLTFFVSGDEIRDEETGSVWDVFGRAQEGPLAGKQLNPVVAINHFWFSWAAFRPETRVYRGTTDK